MLYSLIIRVVLFVINTLLIKCKVKNFPSINRLKPAEKSVECGKEKIG